MISSAKPRLGGNQALVKRAGGSELREFLRGNWYSLLLILTVAWIANYLHFTHFGLYDDDWFFVGTPFVMDAKTWMTGSLWAQLSNPAYSQGRPLQMIFCYTFAMLGGVTNRIELDYVIAYLLFAGSAVLMYAVLRRRFTRLVATLAALLFVLTPLHTLHQFLNGQFSFGPPFLLVFGAMLLYVRRRRAWAYALAPLALLSYESVFFLFLGAPLLRPGRIFKRRRREWAIHLGACTIMLLGYLVARKSLFMDTRVSGLPSGASLVWPTVHSWLYYTFSSSAMYLYAALRANEASFEGCVYLLVFCGLLVGLLYVYRRTHAVRVGKARGVCRLWRQAGISFVFLALGYLLSYFYFKESSPVLYLTDRATRISAAASFGSSMLVGVVLGGLVQSARTKLYRAIVYFCMGVFFAIQFLYSFVIQDDYVRDWARQRGYAAQVISATPDVQSDSVIVLQLNPGDLRFFMRGRHRLGIGAERHFYEQLFTYLYRRDQMLPRLFIVYSNDWVKYLKQDPDGFISFTQPVFPGRWFPATERYRRGRFIMFDEIEPGWIVRRTDPILVNTVPVGQEAATPGPGGPLWGRLAPSRLMPKFLPDYSWKSSGHVANRPPVVVSGVPAEATGSVQSFTFTGRDPDGYRDVYRMYFLVNSTPAIPQNTCHGFYDSSLNVFYLYNDAVTSAMGPLVPGSAGTLQNSQCQINGSASALVSASGTDVTIKVSLRLNGAYAEKPQNVYFWVKDSEGHDTGWVRTGTWRKRQ